MTRAAAIAAAERYFDEGGFVADLARRPHSYASCSQHAPNEHMLAPVAREALQVMAGLYWDLGEEGVPQRP